MQSFSHVTSRGDHGQDAYRGSLAGRLRDKARRRYDSLALAEHPLRYQERAGDREIGEMAGNDLVALVLGLHSLHRRINHMRLDRP